MDIIKGNKPDPLEQEAIYTQYPESIKNENIATEELAIYSINFTHSNCVWRQGVLGSSWGQGDEKTKPVAGFSTVVTDRYFPTIEFPKLFAISSTSRYIVDLQRQTGLPFHQSNKIFRVEIPGELFSLSGCDTLIKVVKDQNRYKRVPKVKINLNDFMIELIGVEVKSDMDIFAAGQNLAMRNDTHCLYLYHTYSAINPYGLGMYLPPKKFHICLARIFCTHTEAFVEYRWHPEIGISIDLRNLDRVEPKRRVVEAQQALKGMYFLGLAKESRGGSEREDEFRKFHWHYKNIYPKWKEAIIIYKQCIEAKEPERRKKWKESILSIFPELREQPDLLERISNTPKLSDKVLSLLAEKGGASTANEIALEHAARLCGAKKYSYPIGTLKGILRIQKKYK